MRTRASTKQAESAQWDRFSEAKKQLVMPELTEAVYLQNASFARSIYHELADESVIGAFLKKTRCYSLTQRRWKLPRSFTKLLDGDCHTPFFDIISSIIKHFWTDAVAQGTRQVVDTHATDIWHSKTDGLAHKSRPSFVIKAEGPSFQLPKMLREGKVVKLGFCNIASCIEVQVDSTESTSEQLIRMAVYARQLFIHQPNRIFVRVLLLNGPSLRLFHFDRSGVQYTPFLDIHSDPHTFIRLVLGLSSPDETDIGLDTSIQWQRLCGRKISGTLTTRGSDGTDVVYPLLSINPFFSRSDIFGRCTTLWSVSDPRTGEALLVKDLWRSEGQASECIYLEEARGIPGVVQMVSCEADRGQTKNLRCLTGDLLENFGNLVNTRLVMKRYGEPISEFTSAMQLLCILRDAIAGHRISDMPNPLARDHLDDLESFFYVFTHIIHTYDCDGEFFPLDKDSHLLRWDQYEGGLAATAKRWFVFRGSESTPVEIARRWPQACIQVLHGFQDFLRGIIVKKMKAVLEPSANPVDIQRPLQMSADKHYDAVLRLFDQGIEALEAEDPDVGGWTEEDTSSESTPPSPQVSDFPASTERAVLKRALDEESDAQPAAKRTAFPRDVRDLPRSRASPVLDS
ncbi:hypothetical protein MD484_g6304, partial [Candolleomyces efflorescens]